MEESAVRRDAARNRELLLAAARSVVSAQGPEAPLDEIARTAGVSRTTLHRHFADREALAAAVLRDNVEDIEARAAALAGVADGAEQLYHYLLDIQVEVPWLAQMAHQKNAHQLGDLADRTTAALEPLVARASNEGVLRGSTTAADILLTLPMAMAVLASDRKTGSRDGLARARLILHRGLFTTLPPAKRP